MLCRGRCSDDFRSEPPLPRSLREGSGLLSLGRSDRARLETLRTLAHLEFHFLTLFKRPVASSIDRRVVNEDVGASVVLGDKSKTLVGVKPLHSACCHLVFPSLRKALPKNQLVAGASRIHAFIRLVRGTLAAYCDSRSQEPQRVVRRLGTVEDERFSVSLFRSGHFKACIVKE